MGFRLNRNGPVVTRAELGRKGLGLVRARWKARTAGKPTRPRHTHAAPRGTAAQPKTMGRCHQCCMSSPAAKGTAKMTGGGATTPDVDAGGRVDSLDIWLLPLRVYFHDTGFSSGDEKGARDSSRREISRAGHRC